MIFQKKLPFCFSLINFLTVPPANRVNIRWNTCTNLIWNKGTTSSPSLPGESSPLDINDTSFSSLKDDRFLAHLFRRRQQLNDTADAIDDSCQLSLDAANISAAEKQGSLAALEYRLERRSYSEMPFADMGRSQRVVFFTEFNYQLKFRSSGSSGVIFLYSGVTSSRLLQPSLIVLYLEEGKVHFAFKTTTDYQLYRTNETFNDYHWHLIQFGKTRLSDPIIKIDNESYTIEAGGLEVLLGGRGPNFHLIGDGLVFLGGYPEEVPLYRAQMRPITRILPWFTGCISKSLQVFPSARVSSHQTVTMTTRMRHHGTKPCSGNFESGVYFPSHPVYLLSTGTRISIQSTLAFEMEIKSKVSSAVLMSFQNTNATSNLTLSFNSREVEFVYTKGNQTQIEKVRMSAAQSLCDGKWHKIRAEIRYRSAMTLIVDDVVATSSILPLSYQEEEEELEGNDWARLIYLGGHPNINANFVGCVRDFRINERKPPLKTWNVIGPGSPDFDQCPAL